MLLNLDNSDNNSLSHSQQPIHPVHKPTSISTVTNGQQRIYSYENGKIDIESTEPALKKDKIQTNNIMNGCTFELHPIQIENNNENHRTNNNNRTFYRLNNNHRNGINVKNNNNHNVSNNANNGRTHNDNDAVGDNMKIVHQQQQQQSQQRKHNGTSYETKAMDDVQTINRLSKSPNEYLSIPLGIWYMGKWVHRCTDTHYHKYNVKQNNL